VEHDLPRDAREDFRAQGLLEGVWPSRGVLLALLGHEGFDELGDLVLLAARQRSHGLEDLANPPIGSGIPASSQQAVGAKLFGKNLETRPSAPLCAPVRPKTRENQEPCQRSK